MKKPEDKTKSEGGLGEQKIFAQSIYPNDFKEFGWIKYIHEHRLERDKLLAKRIEIHGQKAINDYWRRSPPPTVEMVMDLLKNEYMRYPSLLKVMSEQDEQRGRTANVWFGTYLNVKYDHGTDLDFKTRRSQFSYTESIADMAFGLIWYDGNDITSPDDPRVEAFIREKLEPLQLKYERRSKQLADDD